MAHKYMIRIRDVHEYDEETAETTVFVFGDLTVEKDRFSITYREESGDLAGCVTTVTCREGREVSVHRDGPYRTDLLMEEGRRHSCQYGTEYGDMLMGIYTEKVEAHMAETGGYLEFIYNIDFDGDFVSRNILHLTVKETF